MSSSSVMFGSFELDEPGLLTKTSLIQIGYGLWANQPYVVVGLAYSFSTVSVPGMNFVSNSWITSALTLFSPIGCMICGYCLDRIGRRAMIVICLAPMALGWFLIGIASGPNEIILGRIITGVGIGMAATPPRVYCTEISLPNMRGVLGAIPTLALATGIFVQSVLGSFLSWEIICAINGTYTILVMLTAIFLPESPYYVLLTDYHNTEATLSLFRDKDHDIGYEMTKLNSYRHMYHIAKLSSVDSLAFICKHKQAFTPFLISVTYLWIGLLSGTSVFEFSSVQIIMDSKIPMNAYLANMILGITRVVSAAILVIVMFTVNRRHLALISALVIVVTCTLVGLYIDQSRTPDLVPLIGFIIYIIACTFGYSTLPFLMLFELVPLQVRGFLGGAAMSVYTLGMFGVNRLYPSLERLIGFTKVISLFGLMSFTGFLFLYFYLPERQSFPLYYVEEFIVTRRARRYRAQLERQDQMRLMIKRLEVETEDKTSQTDESTSSELKELYYDKHKR